MGSEFESADINQRPDIQPISIPYQDIVPSLDERTTRIEEILHIN